MGRPGYMSLYADEKTQQIFDEFVKIKGIKKTKALHKIKEEIPRSGGGKADVNAENT